MEESLKIPDYPKHDIEWVTVTLGIALIVGWTLSALIYPSLESRAALGGLVVFNTLLVYWGFTLVHEGSHRNISKRYSWINTFFGFFAGFMLHGSYRQFVPIHMRHHAYTNAKDKDPDHYVQGPFNFYLLFKLGSILNHYYRYYLRERLYLRTSYVFLTVWMPYIAIFAFYIAGAYYGFFWDLVIFLTIPWIAGTIITGFLFDWLPHYPHESQGRFTHSETRLFFLAGPISMMQTYHVIHHLWPSVPWWRYGQLYRQIRPELFERGHIEKKYGPQIASF